ncbi:hypothetical protein Peur_067579 [Populus x canadensis]
MLSFAVQCNRYIAKTLYGDDEEEETPQDTNDTNVDETKLLDVHPTSDEKVFLENFSSLHQSQGTTSINQCNCLAKTGQVARLKDLLFPIVVCALSISWFRFFGAKLVMSFAMLLCTSILLSLLIKDVDAIALEVALDLLRHLRTLGDHPKDGNPVILKIGRVG